MLYMFLANGFEESEAIVTLDIIRRANIEIKTVGIGSKAVSGSHSVTVNADLSEDEFKACSNEPFGVILPGGMPGTVNLENSKTVVDAVNIANESGSLVCAICAAPSVLGHLNLLCGKKATCYPGFEKELFGANAVKASVVKDGNFITANGPGGAYDFGFEIVAAISGLKKAEEIKKGMQCR